MTEMFGEAWSPMSVPDLAPDDDDESVVSVNKTASNFIIIYELFQYYVSITRNNTINVIIIVLVQ